MANETKMRANSAYTYAVLDGKPTWTYPGIGTFSVDPDKIDASSRHFLMLYGIKQWVNDGGAVEAGPDGKVNPAAKYNGSRERAELLNQGTPSTGLLRRGGGATAFSYVTRALVALGTYQGTDVSTYDKANAFVKRLAEDPKLEKFGFKGQVGKVRTWLENNSKSISAEIEKIKAAEAEGTSAADADAELAALMGDAE